MILAPVLNWLTIINGFYPLQFSLLFIKDLFSEFSLNEFLMNSYEPLVRFSNRIFRVALLFICQCSVFIICFTLSGATVIEYHKLAFPVKHFFKLFLFHHSFPCVKSKSFLVALSVCLSDEGYLTTLSNIYQQEIVSFFIYFSFSIECPFLGLNHLCNSKVSVELCELCNISFVAKKSLSHFILYPPICKRKRCV